MELQFKKTLCPCLDTALWEIQNQEQTLEMKLPDGMPDVGRILAAWGQPVLRSKEWRNMEVSVSGGIQVWVLYAPEDGTQCRCLEGWMPIQMCWDLPEDSPEGSLRVSMLTRFMDARTVSARKIMVRGGIGVMIQALCPKTVEVLEPEGMPENVELLKQSYPLRLNRLAGEKTFQLDEELTLPPSAPEAEKLIYYRVQPNIADQKILGNRMVFRGELNLHILYASEEGQLFSWDFATPISQFADLETGDFSDAAGDVQLCPTNVEVELDDEGHIRLKCGLVAQYLVNSVHMLELTEDAYIPGRDMTVRREQLELPALLDSRRELLSGEQTMAAEAGIAADVQFLPDFPKMYKTEKGIRLEMTGSIQLLHYGENGHLDCASSRWEGQRDFPADECTRIMAVPEMPAAEFSPAGMTVRVEAPLSVVAMGSRGLPMVTGIELGEARKPEAQQPSLILRRAGEDSLWEIAKASGSTRSAIRTANGLEGDPLPGQMLLIPVCG